MNKILQICERTGFLRPVYSGKSLDYLAFGPNGELLVNNVKEEWIYSCVKNIGTNVFPFYRGSAPTLNISEGIAIKLQQSSQNNGHIPQNESCIFII